MSKPRRQLTDLSPTRREQALERYRILRPHLEDGVSLARVAVTDGRPYRTLQRWLADYRRDGLATLAQDGTRGYRERCELVHRREASRPNHGSTMRPTTMDTGRPATAAS
ncbi:Homeodomain-like domain-containing protein [Nonomuraea polychroma]|uniref:Homeodomain-like domain-containing protein n=1 Tax=Nonomuraea polychroma TaxID=46176 RepID=A0A438M6B9_9ACTN|nr:helix-turn-helix domain-containing protein [Nonomuraea polychroma]RVX41223.1 Homeodomain-like domain-containing protein [Nonomuraea polychroma]